MNSVSSDPIWSGARCVPRLRCILSRTPAGDSLMTQPYTDTRDIGHYIHGERVASTSGRSQAVYNPATGAVARQVALASVDEVNAAVASAKAAFPAWSETPPIRRAPGDEQLPRADERTPRRTRRDDHRRARQGLHRRDRRSQPGHRHRRVRLRHPAVAEGRLHRPGLDRHRQLDDAPVAGRGGRHHAVQLPVHGAVLDVPGGDRLRQQLHPQAQRA